MNTHNRILSAIDKFNNDCGGQANLASQHAREDLADAIYNAVMKQTASSETTNQQQVIIFSNIEDSEHK